MARKISVWRRRGSEPADRPSRNPSDYSVSNPLAEAPRFVHEVHDLYAAAHKGDLIIVPGRGYNSTVYFGEFVSDFDPNHTIETRLYESEKVPARKVRWLPIAMAKREFSRRLVRLMQNRQAIIQITQEIDRRYVYEHAYGDYVWKESSGNLIRITKQEVDLNDLSKAVDLTNYFAAQYLALKKKELDKFAQLDFGAAIDA